MLYAEQRNSTQLVHSVKASALAGVSFAAIRGQPGGNQLQEGPTNWLTFVARYRDGSLERFAVDAFTLLRGNYTACDDAGKQQEKGSLKLGEIVLVYHDRGFVT
jgi:hypothetical protein